MILLIFWKGILFIWGECVSQVGLRKPPGSFQYSQLRPLRLHLAVYCIWAHNAHSGNLVVSGTEVGDLKGRLHCL